MPTDVMERLHLANRSLREKVAGWQAGRPLTSATQDFAEVLTELRSVRARWGQIFNSDMEIQREVSEYRHNLEQLAKILPAIHGKLLAEKGRLQTRRNHLSAAAAWAESRAKTL
jgi:hypothetical protein